MDEDKDRAVTVRPSSTAILAIDSADRYPAEPFEVSTFTSPYDFQITRNQAILNGFFTRIALTEVVFPYYIPNINAYTNQLYYKINGGGLLSITLPKGFYTPDELAAAVQTLLQAGGLVAATVTYNALSLAPSSFLIETNAVDTVQFLRGNTTSLPNSATSLTRFQLFDLMKLNDDDATDIFGGTTRCRYIEYVDVVCTQLTYNQDLKDSSSDPAPRDVLARIYLETENEQIAPVWNGAKAIIPAAVAIPGTYPFTIYRQFKTPKQILWNRTQPVGNLRFELFDNHGQALDSGLYAFDPVTGNAQMPDWRITLLVSEN
jgi:hypothetical protein